MAVFRVEKPPPLALSELLTSAYYGYIALYVLFFMLDDLGSFGFVAFACQK